MTTSFGQRLRWQREERGLSLDQLASRAGISRAYLWKLEKKPDANPSIDLVDRLAEALSITSSELIGDDRKTPEGQPSIPAPLQELQQQRKLADAEVEDLARIQFRGRRPATSEDWELLYLQLRRILGRDPEE